MGDQKINTPKGTLDLPKIIKDYSSMAAACIEQQDFENALDSLIQCRELLTSLEGQAGVIEASLWVETFHNSALCYQKLGKLEDCVRCLEECLYFLKDKTPWEVKYHKHFLNTSKDYLEKITKSKYKCKVNIQLCAILSQLNRHESALIHAKKALDRAERAVMYCYEICKDHLSLHKRLIGYSKLKSQHSQYKLLESPHYIYFTSLVNFAFPILKNLAKILKKSSTVDFRKSNGLSLYAAEWLMGFQIGDMMIIDYLDFNELKSRTGIDDEISSDLLLEKICFLTISAYCIGTEIRMLSNQKFSKYTLADSKEYYLNSVTFAEFIPKNSLIYNYILVTFNKYFGEYKTEKKVKEVTQEKVKKKNYSPEIERIYRPKSLKTIKKASPSKKNKVNNSLGKIFTPVSQRRDYFYDSMYKDKSTPDFSSANRNEPDPETIIE